MNSLFWFVVGLVWLALMGWTWRRARQKNQPSGWHWDILAGGLLFGLTLGFFWRTLSGDVYQPADGGDLVSFLFPTYRFAAAQLHEWTLPLWNPTLYGGAPFISDIQAGFLYPPNLLLFLLKPNFAYRILEWLAIGHLYWAGLGMYVLLRTLRWGAQQPVSRPAALFGALAFQFSDPLLIHLGNLNLIAVLSWLPWVLAAYHRALATRRWRWASIAALLFALGNYAGHAQSTLYIGLAVVLYTMFWLYGEIGDWGWGIRTWLRFLVTNLQSLLLLGLLTFLLTAPLLLPAQELIRYTARNQFTYQDTVNFSLAPTQAIGLLTPGFFGYGPALHWSLWQRVETPYAGVATLILAAAGLLLAENATRRKLWPWVGLAFFGFVTALGIYALLHGWLTLLLPGFGQLRAPARALVLWTFGVAVLAAVGFDAVMDKISNQCAAPNPPPSSPSENASLATLHTLLKTIAGLLAGLALPLVYVAMLLTQQNETAFLRASLAALALTQATGFWLGSWALIQARRAVWISGGVFAVLMIALLFTDLSTTSAYTDISPTDPTTGFHHPEIIAFLKNDPELFRIDTRTDIAAVWQPDTAALANLQDVGGIVNPLALNAWQQLWASTGGRQTQAYDLLNVKYVIVHKGTPLPEGKFVLALEAPDDLAVYRNKNFVPRAWLADANADLNKLTPLPGAPPATITHYGSNDITLHVQTAGPTYLVLSELWYPGWYATVNGQPAEILAANHAFRAVALPGGAATVQFWFAPTSWRVGIGAFVVGLLLCVALGWAGR